LGFGLVRRAQKASSIASFPYYDMEQSSELPAHVKHCSFLSTVNCPLSTNTTYSRISVFPYFRFPVFPYPHIPVPTPQNRATSSGVRCLSITPVFSLTCFQDWKGNRTITTAPGLMSPISALVRYSAR